eukprot:TRINITY_DN58844_c0_g1_i1.p1 TRINITY_DN58844_c0_g1~~TRINITY_DN58844_c0_g1_i1.p1  ORF type:complete len:714 (-),score=95.12 TRINITY_DN58844_c0_g1_i1:13-2154(-)
MSLVRTPRERSWTSVLAGRRQAEQHGPTSRGPGPSTPRGSLGSRSAQSAAPRQASAGALLQQTPGRKSGVAASQQAGQSRAGDYRPLRESSSATAVMRDLKLADTRVSGYDELFEGGGQAISPESSSRGRLSSPGRQQATPLQSARGCWANAELALSAMSTPSQSARQSPRDCGSRSTPGMPCFGASALSASSSRQPREASSQRATLALSRAKHRACLAGLTTLFGRRFNERRLCCALAGWRLSVADAKRSKMSQHQALLLVMFRLSCLRPEREAGSKAHPRRTLEDCGSTVSTVYHAERARSGKGDDAGDSMVLLPSESFYQAVSEAPTHEHLGPQADIQQSASNSDAILSLAMSEWSRAALCCRMVRAAEERKAAAARVRQTPAGRSVFRLGRAGERLCMVQSRWLLRAAISGWQMVARASHEQRSMLCCCRAMCAWRSSSVNDQAGVSAASLPDPCSSSTPALTGDGVAPKLAGAHVEFAGFNVRCVDKRMTQSSNGVRQDSSPSCSTPASASKSIGPRSSPGKSEFVPWRAATSRRASSREVASPPPSAAKARTRLMSPVSLASPQRGTRPTFLAASAKPPAAERGDSPGYMQPTTDMLPRPATSPAARRQPSPSQPLARAESDEPSPTTLDSARPQSPAPKRAIVSSPSEAEKLERLQPAAQSPQHRIPEAAASPRSPALRPPPSRSLLGRLAATSSGRFLDSDDDDD